MIINKQLNSRYIYLSITLRDINKTNRGTLLDGVNELCSN